MIFISSHFAHLVFESVESLRKRYKRHSTIANKVRFLNYLVNEPQNKYILTFKKTKMNLLFFISHKEQKLTFISGKIPLKCIPLEEDLDALLVKDEYDIKTIYFDQEGFHYAVKIHLDKRETALIDECSVCYENDKKAYIKPFTCTHKDLCVDCFEKLKDPKCPMCRADIKNY